MQGIKRSEQQTVPPSSSTGSTGSSYASRAKHAGKPAKRFFSSTLGSLLHFRASSSPGNSRRSPQAVPPDSPTPVSRGLGNSGRVVPVVTQSESEYADAIFAEPNQLKRTTSAPLPSLQRKPPQTAQAATPVPPQISTTSDNPSNSAATAKELVTQKAVADQASADESAKKNALARLQSSPQLTIAESSDTSPPIAGGSASLPRSVSVPNPADMLLESHLQKHPHPHLVGSETVVAGLRKTQRPSLGLTLPLGGPKLNPLPAATQGPSEMPPPPPSPGLKGSEGERTWSALKRFVGMHLPWKGRSSISAIGDNPAAAFNAPNALQTHVARRFSKSGDEAALAALTERLESALRTPAESTSQSPAESPTTLAFSHHILVAERLAEVTGKDAGRAVAALEALEEGKFVPSNTIADLLGLASGRETRAQASIDALSVAGLLAESEVGMDALCRLTREPVAAERLPGLKRMLEAAAQIASEQGKPADLARHTMKARIALEEGNATLAQHVLHIEATAFDQPDAKLSPADKGALLAWNNEYRERGRGSPFAKTKARIAKLQTYVDRSKKMQTLRDVTFDRDDKLRSIGRVASATARIGLIRVKQVFGHAKSPFSALRAFGANNAVMGQPMNDAKTVDQNAARVIKDLSAMYAKRLDDPRQYQQRLTTKLKNRRLPKPLERAALLEHWQSLVEEKGLRPLAYKLDQDDVKQIALRISQRYRVGAALPQLESRLRRWVGRELTVADLRKWAKEIDAPMVVMTRVGETIAAGAAPEEAHARVEAERAAELAAAREMEVAGELAGTRELMQAGGTGAARPVAAEPPTWFKETPLGEALRKAIAVVATSDALPDDLTPDSLHRFMRNYLLEHNYGNPVTASNGGTVGINTGTVTEAVKKLTHLLSPFSVLPIIDLRLSRAHNAVLSFGSSTQGTEMFIGTQRQTTHSAGAGVMVNLGHILLKHLLGQASSSAVATPYAFDDMKMSGVMIRAVRQPTADGSAIDTAGSRAELVRFNDLLWSMLKGEKGKLDADGMWETIAEHFLDSPNISIGWQDQDTVALRHNVTAQASGRAGPAITPTEAFRPGFLRGYTAELTSYGRNRRTEKTGKNRLVRVSRFLRFSQTSVRGGAVTDAPLPLVPADMSAGASLNTVAIQKTQAFQLDDRGFTGTFRTVMESGKFSEMFTLREFEERDARAYVDFMKEPAHEEQFRSLFVGTFGEETGSVRFEQFLQMLRNWEGPGQHFYARYRLRATDRKALNELAALAQAVYKNDPRDPMLADIEADMKRRLRDEKSWMPNQVLWLEGQSALDSIGINLGIQLLAQDSVISDRQLGSVPLPLPLSEYWSTVALDAPTNGTPQATSTTTTPR